jgi:hypothetical protein
MGRAEKSRLRRLRAWSNAVRSSSGWEIVAPVPRPEYDGLGESKPWAQKPSSWERSLYRKGDRGALGESWPGTDPRSSESWATRGGCITLAFDTEGPVAGKHFTPAYPSRRDWLARLKALLGI